MRARQPREVLPLTDFRESLSQRGCRAESAARFFLCSLVEFTLAGARSSHLARLALYEHIVLEGITESTSSKSLLYLFTAFE